MDVAALFFCGGAEDVPQVFADGFSEGDVGCDSVAEECVFISSAGAVVVLVKEDDVSGCVLFL